MSAAISHPQLHTLPRIAASGAREVAPFKPYVWRAISHWPEQTSLNGVSHRVSRNHDAVEGARAGLDGVAASASPGASA